MKLSRIESQDGAKKKYKNTNGEEVVYLNYTPMPITKIISPKYSRFSDEQTHCSLITMDQSNWKISASIYFGGQHDNIP